ncbi:MAG TPA: hypothetical protein P5026_14360 [Kiritimatiellia bacterium]|nr:hypothetical protein [Kiritimatiellia bacterium]
MATFFLYFCDVTVPLRFRPGNIVFRNCTVDNVSRLIRYNFGGETWQHAAPLTDVTFENVRATNLWNPVALNASSAEGENVPLVCTMRHCEIGFNREVPEVFSCLNVKTLTLEDVAISGTTAPLIRTWGPAPQLLVKNLTGLAPRMVDGKAPYKCPPR